MVENSNSLRLIGVVTGIEEYVPTVEEEVSRFRSDRRCRYSSTKTLQFLIQSFIELIKLVLIEGLLLKHEKELLYEVEARDGCSKMCLTVTNWTLLLIKEGRDAEYFESASDANRLFDPVFAFKKSLSSVLKFQSTPIPLSFIQVSILILYNYIIF